MQIVESDQKHIKSFAKYCTNTYSSPTCGDKPVDKKKNLCITQPAYKSIQFFIILSDTFSDPPWQEL